MKLPSDAPRFVATVGCPYPDESLMGYLTRALSVATVDRLSAALRLAGVAQRNPNYLSSSLKNKGEIARIAHLIGCEPSDIVARTHRMLPRTSLVHMMDFFGTGIRPRYMDSRARRVSPRALQCAPYHRAVWGLRVFSFDPATKETLLDACPACRRQLGWRHALGPTACEKCVDKDGLPTVDLRDFEQPLIEVADEEALDFVTGLILPDAAGKEAARKLLPTEFSGVSDATIFDTVVAVASALVLCGEPDLDRRGVELLGRIAPEHLCLAGRAMIGGQAGFDALCDQFRDVTGKRAGRHGLNKELGHLTDLSRSDFSIDPVLQRSFRTMILRNVHAAIASELGGGEEVAVPLPITRLAAELGTRPEFLRRLSRSGLVAAIRAEDGKVPVRMAAGHVAPIVTRFKEALRPQTAAAILRMPAFALEGLAEHGLIERLDAPVASMLAAPAAYSIKSVDKLLSNLRAATRSPASGDPLLMLCTHICVGATPWTAVIKSILELPGVVRLGRQSFGFDRMMVADRDVFLRTVRRHLASDERVSNDWIGPAEAAGILKITYAAFWRLDRSRPDVVRRQRDDAKCYRLSEIQRLAETYIFVPEIAFHRELHPRLAVAWLESIGVEPAFSVSPNRDLAYLRTEVESWLGRWRERQPGEPIRRAAGRFVASKHHTEHS